MVLLDKTERRKVEYVPTYVGFPVRDCLLCIRYFIAISQELQLIIHKYMYLYVLCSSDTNTYTASASWYVCICFGGSRLGSKSVSGWVCVSRWVLVPAGPMDILHMYVTMYTCK